MQLFHRRNTSNFCDGLACASPVIYNGNSKYGFINKQGEWVIKPQFLNIGTFSEGLCCIRHDDGNVGFINKQGEWVIKPQFQSAENFKEGLACVKLYRWGFIDKQGQWVILPQFDKAYSFSEGLAAVEIKTPYKKWALGRKRIKYQLGYINRQGNWKISPYRERFGEDYYQVFSFSEGLARISKDFQYRFINETDDYTVYPQFAAAGDFHEGLVWVKKEDKYGFINRLTILV
jgi:WG containing repeat